MPTRERRTCLHCRLGRSRSCSRISSDPPSSGRNTRRPCRTPSLATTRSSAGAIEAHKGHVVKTTGDGAHAAFATASDAVDAALAAQLALTAQDWGATGPLLVRMGLHTGAAELRDGDYYGTALNRAARISSVAHGGQIVVSLTTGDLLRDAPIELLDLGEHRLQRPGRAGTNLPGDPRGPPAGVPRPPLRRELPDQPAAPDHVVRRT